MSSYNGHRSYEYWNVALWLANDESLYNLARECKAGAANGPRPLTTAARAFLDAIIDLTGKNFPRTPDGVRYTLDRVRRGISDL